MVYRPTARVLTVLELLQSHGRMTGAELARRLEVNIRTVRDYIEMLADLGIPVEAERGRYGGYRLRPGYKLPPLIFTESESVALTLALLIARVQGFAQASVAFEGVFAKVMRVLPEATRTQVKAVEQTILFDDAVGAPPSLLAVTVLSSALQAGQRVRLCYRSGQGEVSERAFDPYGVVARGGTWYTIGYCHMRQAQRLFRLDRIVQIALTSETFERPVNFAVREGVQQALAAAPNAWRIEVWLQTTLLEAQRSLHLSSAYFEEQRSGVLLRADADELSWVAQKLAGLGAPFIIHQPQELREVMSQYGRQLALYAEQTNTEGTEGSALER